MVIRRAGVTAGGRAHSASPSLGAAATDRVRPHRRGRNREGARPKPFPYPSRRTGSPARAYSSGEAGLSEPKRDGRNGITTPIATLAVGAITRPDCEAVAPRRSGLLSRGGSATSRRTRHKSITLICRRLLIVLRCSCGAEEGKSTAPAVPNTNDSARRIWVGIARSGPAGTGALTRWCRVPSLPFLTVRSERQLWAVSMVSL